MRERDVYECTYTNGHNGILEKNVVFQERSFD